MGSSKVHFRLVQDGDGYPPGSVESLWAQTGNNAGEYVVDNVPLFTRDATIGDVVHVREEDGHLWFDKVVHRSTNSLVRVVFFDPNAVERVNERLVNLGCSTEYLAAHKLLAVSIPITVSLQNVQGYLKTEASSGTLDYEEPILRQ